MTITKVGKSQYPNAYVYHIKLVFTDSNQKIWTLDKDMDVYGTWSDCDRSGDTPTDMPYVGFAFESGNHNTESEGATTAIGQTDSNMPENGTANSRKILKAGHLYLLHNDKTYDVTGKEVK